MSVTAGCLNVSCCSKCLFVYGSFCHGALKLDRSTLFATCFSLNISSVYTASIHHYTPASINLAGLKADHFPVL